MTVHLILAAVHALDLRAEAHFRAGRSAAALRAWRAADRIHFRALRARL